MRPIVALALAALAAPALAQDAASDEWALIADAPRQLTTAFVAFEPGPAIMVRCNHHAYEAVIMGLPASPGTTHTRPLRIAFADKPFEDQTWNVGLDRTMAVGDLPAPFARQLRLGGRLQVVVPGAAEGGRNLRYDVTLPPSPAAIDATLTACDRPLVDPRDAELSDIPDSGLAPALSWVHRPRVEFPENPKYVSGWAVLTCLAQQTGELTDCVVESEYPYDGGFGDAVLKRMRTARIHYDGARGPAVRVSFRLRFLMR